MFVVYGSFQHKIDSAGITISAEVEETDTGVPYRTAVNVDIEGRLQNEKGATANRIDYIISRMQAAYSLQGQDFGLLHNDGRRSSAFWRNDQTIGGIRTKMVAYPKYQGGEYCTYRSFKISMQLYMPLGETPAYTRFAETLSIEGGGDVYGVREVNYGPGVRQRKRTHQKCTATQSGTAVARNMFPLIPPPIWPNALVSSTPKITRQIRPRGGKTTNNIVLEECEIGWSYEFEWPYHLDGIPHYVTGE